MDLEPASERLIGQVLASRYRIEARLGHGAMGTVYRARHVKVGRAFAIKVLHRRFLTDIKTRRRFAREAELAGALHHANVVSVVDVGETLDGMSYLVMEYAEGRTLCELVHDTAPMSGARVIAIARQLCDGLQHAHEHGLIHRDLKTENVLVERSARGETVRIVDFGIAILREDATSSDPARLTSAGLVLGTPHYMAPEHATGAPIDHRIDLFALGVMCFEMLTGVVPFDGDGVDVARANLLLDTPAMSVRVPNLRVDPLLEAFTRKLMMKSRDDRPATAQAARDLLDLIERDRPAAAEALGIGLDGGVAGTRSGAPRLAWTPLPRHPVPLPTPAVRSTGSRTGTEDTDLALRITPSGPVLADATPAEQARSVPSPSDPPPLTPPEGDETEQMVPLGLRRWQAAIAVLAALAVVVVVVALALAMRSRRSARPSAPLGSAPIEAPHEPQQPVIAPAPDVEPRPSAVAPPHSPVEPTEPGLPAAAATAPATRSPSARPLVTGSALEPAAPRAPDEPSASPEHAGPPPPPAALPAPGREIARPSGQPIPLPAGPTATAVPAEVAELYAALGRRLKALDERLGSAATADLWPLYLRVRINDVITDPVKCAEADVLLRYLDDQVARRSRTQSSSASPPAGSRESSVNPGGSVPPNP